MKNFVLVLACCVLAIGNVFGLDFNEVKETESRYASDITTYGGTMLDVRHRTVTYNSKETDTYVNPYSAPSFKANISSSDCAVEASGNSLVYYDRIFDELVPDYSPKRIFGVFTYGSQNQGVNNMFSTLYDLMGTNSDGTTISGFKSGLKSYVQGRGRSLQTISSTGNFYNTNLDYLKSQLEQENVAVIFLDGFSITTTEDIQLNNGYDEIKHTVYTGCHAMLVYGYLDYYYYNSNGSLINRDTYLYVSTGYVGASLAVLNMQNFCTIDDIYILSIT